MQASCFAGDSTARDGNRRNSFVTFWRFFPLYIMEVRKAHICAPGAVGVDDQFLATIARGKSWQPMNAPP